MLFLFVTDALFAQVEFDEWMKKRDEEFSHFQNSLYEEWSQMQREKYARWKELQSNSQTGSDFIDEGFNDSSSAGVVRRKSQPHTPAAKVWVVIIGIAEYDLDILNLRFTKDDAYRMYAFYKSMEGGSLPDEQITLLLDIQATRSNVMQALTTYTGAGKEDAIVFYFAGHGTPGNFLLHEFDDEEEEEEEELSGLLKHDELNRVFIQSQAKYKYIIADACHSGSLAESSTQKKSEKRGAYRSFEDSEKGFVMMLSSMGKEVSVEHDGIRQGIFSYHLIKGMKGSADKNKDGIVSVIELFDFVDAEVKTATEGKQNPVLAGDYDDSLPVSVLKR